MSLLAMSRRTLVAYGHLFHKEARDFLTGPRRSKLEGPANVDVALGYAPGGVS
jgi:hypothetical protein